MTVIDRAGELCTVIVTVDAEPEVLTEMMAHARSGLTMFRAFPGFVSGALHASRNGGRFIQYLQWRSEADHRACIEDSRWDDHEPSRRFMEHVASGRASVDVRVYDVIASSDPAGTADGG